MSELMVGVEVEGRGTPPGAGARRRVAIELVRNHDQPLRWTARRYSICAEDAEDAYQRGIEILLSKAPTTDLNQLLPWARTVVKHEALAIRRSRERILARPGIPADGEQAAEDWLDLIPAEGDGPDELAVRRERVARSREALSNLKPAELKALTQLAEGFSYREIGSLNNWTQTKVNRCLAEGRARFRSAFRESESGELCRQFEPLLSACCDGELSEDELAGLERHLAACGSCRSTLRTYRAAPRAAAALAPLIPAGTGFWERAQELLVQVQLRFHGIGRGSDTGVGGMLASGGTRGAGVAAAAKLAAICAGTAGTAAVCAATGIMPASSLLSRQEEKPAVPPARVVNRSEPPRVPMVFVERETAPAGNQPGGKDRSANPPKEPTSPPPASGGESAETPAPAPAPVPTPTETEFTAEAAGTPVGAPVTPPPAAQASSQVPVGNGGGEFAP